MENCSNKQKVDKDYWQPKRLPDTQDQECELREFFEKREEKHDSLPCIFLWYLERRKELFDIADKIIPFDIQIKEKERNFFPASRVLNGPVKWQENTGDHDNTREKEDCPLPLREFT